MPPSVVLGHRPAKMGSGCLVPGRPAAPIKSVVRASVPASKDKWTARANVLTSIPALPIVGHAGKLVPLDRPAYKERVSVGVLQGPLTPAEMLVSTFSKIPSFAAIARRVANPVSSVPVGSAGVLLASSCVAASASIQTPTATTVVAVEMPAPTEPSVHRADARPAALLRHPRHVQADVLIFSKVSPIVALAAEIALRTNSAREEHVPVHKASPHVLGVVSIDKSTHSIAAHVAMSAPLGSSVRLAAV